MGKLTLFIVILMLASQRADEQFIELLGTKKMKQALAEKDTRQRGNGPTILEYIILIYILGEVLIGVFNI